MNAGSYMHSICWVCTSCGFLLEGGQPHMECPICESYKDAFIDTPSHVEADIRKQFGDAINAAEARKTRLQILTDKGYTRKFRVKGRVTELVNLDSASRKTL
jgi:hypothetical protein